MATMNRTTTTYSGPSMVLYETINQVTNGQVVTAKWQEGDYYYIDYGTNTKNCGYVLKDYVSGVTSITTKTFTLGVRRLKETVVSYYGPHSSIYPSAGSVASGTDVAYVTVDGSYTFIELASGSKKKRVYVDSTKLINPIQTFIDVAKAEIGETNKSKYGASSNEAWCAYFVTWCAKQAGMLTSAATNAIPYVYNHAFAPTMYNNYVSNNRGVEYPSTLSSSPNYPRVGDIAFMANKGSTDIVHVGIITAVSGVNVTTVEGNAENKVSTYTYDSNLEKYQKIIRLGRNTY